MNFNWETLLDLAQELFKAAETESGQKREASLRTATGRAYYAAFGASVAWLREHYPAHPLPGHGEIHKAAADFFLFHPEPAGREIGELLRDLRLRAIAPITGREFPTPKLWPSAIYSTPTARSMRWEASKSDTKKAQQKFLPRLFISPLISR